MTPQELLTVPPGPDALAAAHGLAERLEAAGHQPHVMKMLHGMSGLAMVHVHHEGADDEVILVNSGDASSLREDAMKFQQLPAKAPWRLAAAIDVPDDVKQVFTNTEAARLTFGLAAGGAVPLTMPLVDVTSNVDALVAHLEEALDTTIDLAGGKETLAHIDALVDRLRPDGVLSDDAVTPFHALMALGLVATETARRMGPPSHLGKMDETFEEAETLGEAHCYPAVAFHSGQALQIARKVPLRYLSGPSHSLVDLWELAGVPAAVSDEEKGALKESLNTAVSLARSLVDFVALGLKEDGEAGPPVAWMLVDGQISIARLMADGDRALEMYQGMITKSPTIASAFVADAYATNPATGVKRDALDVNVGVGSEILVRMLVPYVLQDGEVTFPDQAQWVQGPKAWEYTASDGQAAFIGEVGEADVLTEVRDDYFNGGKTKTGAGEAPLGQVGQGGESGPTMEDVDVMMMRLAGLAPFALFLGVAMADGDLDDSETAAFAQDLFGDDTDPLLAEMIMALEMNPNERFRMIVEVEGLGGRALAAAGALFASHPDGPAAREAFVALGESIASADGVVTDDEREVLDGLLDALELGSLHAMTGGDPFRTVSDLAPFGDLPMEVVALSSLAPFASFMMVAGADGDLDPSEVLTFVQRIGTETNPLLKAMLTVGDIPMEERFEHLADNEELVKASLMAAMVVFNKADGGAEARNALMDLLEAIAAADGTVDPQEKQALSALGQIFDGRAMGRSGPSIPWVPIAIGVAVFGALAFWAMS